MSLLTRAELESAYLEACEIELRAFKPGNVSVHSEGHDMTADDFRRSAQASAPHLCDDRLSLGEKVLGAIRATNRAVGCNTNLGIVLLAAPLMQSCHSGKKNNSLRENLRQVLDATTVEDADRVYQAIRIASPGGLGESPEQDVRAAPQVTLLEAMRIAAGRDRIAYQYANCYADVLDLAIPSYDTALSRWGSKEWAAVAVFVELLERIPDSHVERKFGARFTRMVTDRMTIVGRALSNSTRPEQTLQLLQDVDAEFKSAGINPGTTADLTVTCLLVAHLQSLLGVHNGEERGALAVR
jgi:triphosphoribosyl-dephospho-CoA synthase